jgi:hypothetical protein
MEDGSPKSEVGRKVDSRKDAKSQGKKITRSNRRETFQLHSISPLQGFWG